MSGPQVDLLEFIDWSSVECLNQQPEHSVQNALKQVAASAAFLGVYEAPLMPAVQKA